VIEILNAVGDVLHDAWLGFLIGLLIFGPAIWAFCMWYLMSLAAQHWPTKGDE
jgi:hypothetical protein